MSRLICDAVNCAYNFDRLCSLEQIEVCGSDARDCEQTCCGSFSEGQNSVLSSFADVSPDENTQIDCEAGACTFNLDGQCHAQKVKVEGEYAHRSESTCCGTFREEND